MPTLNHTFFTHRAARVWRGELFINRASKWEAGLVQAGPRQVLALAGKTGVVCGQQLTANPRRSAVTERLCTDRTAGVWSGEQDVTLRTVNQTGTLLSVTAQVLLSIRHHLTSADLTGVIGGMETLPWAVYFALKYTVITHGAALPGHVDEVVTGR